MTKTVSSPGSWGSQKKSSVRTARVHRADWVEIPSCEMRYRRAPDRQLGMCLLRKHAFWSRL